jgi:hypothetical protein
MLRACTRFLIHTLFLFPVLARNPRPYSLPDAHLRTTNILNHGSYLSGLDDHQWYLDNIPFIDVPDKSMQEVYYYRASVVKRHIKWAHEGHGLYVPHLSIRSIMLSGSKHRDGVHPSGFMGEQISSTSDLTILPGDPPVSSR